MGAALREGGRVPHVMLGNASAIAVITDGVLGQKTRHRFTNIAQSTAGPSVAEQDLRRQIDNVWNLIWDVSDVTKPNA
jgi:hypothetical protein